MELIRGTMNRLKLENVRPAVKDASVPREDMAMTLDAALVDAPCSGTGVMNEKPDVKYRVTEEGVQALCRTQKDILDAVAPMVKVGGTLVYSTCSILLQENEEQIRIEEEYYRMVHHMIASLPRERREVMLLTLEGKKNEEIATELDISVNTVKTLKKRAYSYLRERLPREAVGLLWLILWNDL